MYKILELKEVNSFKTKAEALSFYDKAKTDGNSGEMCIYCTENSRIENKTWDFPEVLVFSDDRVIRKGAR